MPRKAALPKPKPQYPLEKDEQIKLCAWMRKKNIFFFAIPNGGSRHRLEAYALKRAGLLPGVPDLCVPIPSCGKHGLYIELKRQGPGSKISPEQEDVVERLNNNGYMATVCYGFEEAKSVVEDYLNNVPRRTYVSTKKEAYEQICLPNFM